MRLARFYLILRSDSLHSTASCGPESTSNGQKPSEITPKSLKSTEITRFGPIPRVHIGPFYDISAREECMSLTLFWLGLGSGSLHYTASCGPESMLNGQKPSEITPKSSKSTEITRL
jgi:hypothetical protein